MVGGCYILNLKERVGTFSNGEPLKDFKHQKMWVSRALEILIWLQSVCSAEAQRWTSELGQDIRYKEILVTSPGESQGQS